MASQVQFPGRMSWKVSMTRISRKFTEMGLLERALGTQFQYMFRAPNLLFSGTIIHQLLLRRSSSDCTGIVFSLNGKELSFGMKEYAIVTGLNFGRFPAVGREDQSGCPPLVVKYFNSNNGVRIQDLERVFLSCIDVEDAWKLGLLLLLSHYLFAIDSRRMVNGRLLRMVEDMDTFLQYPWGNVSFVSTLKGVEKDIEHLRTSFFQKKKEGGDPKDIAYTIYGFALSLQVWTYEIMGSLIPKFAERKEPTGSFCPRILLYSSNRKNSYTEVRDAFEKAEVMEMVESEEEKTLYSGPEFEDMEGNVFNDSFEVEGRKRKIEDGPTTQIAKKRKNVQRPRRDVTPPSATPSDDDDDDFTSPPPHQAQPKKIIQSKEVPPHEEIKKAVQEMVRSELQVVNSEIQVVRSELQGVRREFQLEFQTIKETLLLLVQRKAEETEVVVEEEEEEDEEAEEEEDDDEDDERMLELRNKGNNDHIEKKRKEQEEEEKKKQIQVFDW